MLIKEFLLIYYNKKKIQRETSHMDESTMCALASIVGYMDKRKLYEVFEKDVIPLLDLAYKIQEKQNSKFNLIFSDFYHLLFNGCFSFNNLSKTKSINP